MESPPSTIAESPRITGSALMSLYVLPPCRSWLLMATSQAMRLTAALRASGSSTAWSRPSVTASRVHKRTRACNYRSSRWELIFLASCCSWQSGHFLTESQTPAEIIFCVWGFNFPGKLCVGNSGSPFAQVAAVWQMCVKNTLEENEYRWQLPTGRECTEVHYCCFLAVSYAWIDRWAFALSLCCYPGIVSFSLFDQLAEGLCDLTVISVIDDSKQWLDIIYPSVFKINIAHYFFRHCLTLVGSILYWMWQWACWRVRPLILCRGPQWTPARLSRPCLTESSFCLHPLMCGLFQHVESDSTSK